MTHQPIAIVVEGQTEEAFVNQVLAPYVGDAVFLHPIVTQTKLTARGAHRGGGGWRGYRDKLSRLVHEPHWALVTTMIDFYGYPVDAPGRDCQAIGSHRPHACVDERQRAMAADIPGAWLPFVMLHEFETLIIAAGAEMPVVLGDTAAPARFRHMIDEAGEAELVNDSVQTAPSKRVKEVLPRYRKAQDALAVLGDCDFGAVLDACPRFAAWVGCLRAAGASKACPP